MIFIILGIAVVGLLIVSFFHRNKLAREQLLTCFRSGNVLCAGHKGNGKDLLFAYVIRQREKAGEIHAANIKYTNKTVIRSPADYSLKDNTIKNFITGKFNKESVKFTEREDYYISEAGLAFPNWAHNQLEKEAKSRTLPITFALSRQLGDFSIHCNMQEFGRVWDKLREQADWQIYCEGCRIFGEHRKHFRFAMIQFIVYNRYESAYQHIQPYKVRKGILRKNKDDLIRAQEHNARYGLIRRYTIYFKLPSDSETYNTRDFYIKLYQKDPPTLATGSNRRLDRKNKEKNEKCREKKVQQSTIPEKEKTHVDEAVNITEKQADDTIK